MAQMRRKEQGARIEERRQIVFANVLAGATYREIAKELEVSVGTVSSDVKQVMEELHESTVSNAKEYRRVELRRLDVMLNALWDDAKRGKLGAIDRILRLMDQRAKYMPGVQFKPDEAGDSDEVLPWND